MTVFTMFRRTRAARDVPAGTSWVFPEHRSLAEIPARPSSLILRRSLASGDVALCVRSEPSTAWLEVFRAAAGDAKALSELNRLQRVYADPLVRDVFIELTQNEEIET